MEKPEKVDCPKCLGVKVVMIAKATKGFKYEHCSFCDDDGKVTKDLSDDFSLSQDEDTIEYYDDE